MLLGEHEHTLDDKNRLTLPAKLREQLGAQVVVRRGLDGCLYVYAQAEWEQLAARGHARPVQPRGPDDAALLLHRRRRRRARQAGSHGDSGQAARRTRASAARSPWPASTTTSRSGIAPPGASSSRQSKGAQKMLPSVLPTETDHVPVLADEVLGALAPRPGETVVDCTFGAGGHSELLVGRLRGDGKLIAIDRDPTVAPYFERMRRSTAAKVRLLHGEFSVVLDQLASNGVQADAILLDLGVSSMQLDRPERGFSYAVDAPLDMRMDPSAELTARDVVNETDEWELADIFRRYGEERYARPDRARDRQAPRQAAVRAHGRPRRDDQAVDSRAGALRRGPSGQARLPGAADRGQRRARLARAGAPRRARDAAPARTPRGDLVPLARGPDRQALPARRGARLHLPARLPALRLRRHADAARDPAARDPPVGGRGRAQPAFAVGAPSRGGEAWLAPGRRRSLLHARVRGGRPRRRRRLGPRSVQGRSRPRARSHAPARGGGSSRMSAPAARSSGSRSARCCSPASCS